MNDKRTNPLEKGERGDIFSRIGITGEWTMSLTQKTCIPCQGGIPPLTPDGAGAFMDQVPGWSLNDTSDRLNRGFKFDDFVAALDFVNKVGALAEEEGHHPDISFGWGYADIVLFTHKIKGLHENDFIMAAKIGELA